MNEENNQIINEELEVNPIYPKLIQIEIQKKSKNSYSNLDNYPYEIQIFKKRNKARESYKNPRL